MKSPRSGRFPGVKGKKERRLPGLLLRNLHNWLRSKIEPSRSQETVVKAVADLCRAHYPIVFTYGPMQLSSFVKSMLTQLCAVISYRFYDQIKHTINTRHPASSQEAHDMLQSGFGLHRKPDHVLCFFVLTLHLHFSHLQIAAYLDSKSIPSTSITPHRRSMSVVNTSRWSVCSHYTMHYHTRLCNSRHFTFCSYLS